MKKTIFLLLMLFPALLSSAQILKDIGRGIKRDAEYRVEQRARDAVRKGIDSLEKKVKHKKEKKKGSEKQVAGSSNKSAVTEFGRGSEDEKPEEGEGFITLKLSTPFTVKGLTVTISGESIKYQNWNSVKLTIKSPDDEEEVKVNLNDSGKYIIVWDKLLEEGEYKITATSSDGKAKAVEKLWVTDWDAEKDQEKDLMEATGAAFNRLKQKATALEPMISAKDRAALNAKTAEVKARLDALHQFLKSLKKAKNEIGKLYNSGKTPSANIRANLVVLNQMMASKSEEVKKLKQILDHEPYDNSVCEYIAILNEACAAFSTLTNFWTNSVREVIKNIILDKAVPKATEKALDLAGPDKVFKSDVTGDEVTWGAKEASKIFASAQFDMEGLTSKLGKAGFAGDVVQFATDVLMKVHCGIFKGTLNHYYNYIAKNDNGKSWWDYYVKSEAALVLRYPKSSSGIIKMKGTIEGNATKFGFMADPRLNPGYSSGTAGKVQTTILKSYTPYTFSFAGSLYDELGFGMVARAIVTPSYFLIPVDAEYNTQTGKIKIFINEALVDFSEAVFNGQVFIQWSAGLPKLRRQDYPISKARLTMKAALKEKNEFDVKKDAKGNLFISETVKRHIGGDDSEQEHFLDVTISVKKE